MCAVYCPEPGTVAGRLARQSVADRLAFVDSPISAAVSLLIDEAQTGAWQGSKVVASTELDVPFLPDDDAMIVARCQVGPTWLLTPAPGWRFVGPVASVRRQRAGVRVMLVAVSAGILDRDDVTAGLCSLIRRWEDDGGTIEIVAERPDAALRARCASEFAQDATELLQSLRPHVVVGAFSPSLLSLAQASRAYFAAFEAADDIESVCEERLRRAGWTGTSLGWRGVEWARLPVASRLDEDGGGTGRLVRQVRQAELLPLTSRPG